MTAGLVYVPPSAESATELVRGEPGALGRVLVHTAFRTAFIAGGMAAFGAGLEQPKLWRNALGGALALELVMLLYAHHRDQQALQR